MKTKRKALSRSKKSRKQRGGIITWKSKLDKCEKEKKEYQNIINNITEDINNISVMNKIDDDLQKTLAEISRSNEAINGVKSSQEDKQKQEIHNLKINLNKLTEEISELKSSHNREIRDLTIANEEAKNKLKSELVAQSRSMDVLVQELLDIKANLLYTPVVNNLIKTLYG